MNKAVILLDTNVVNKLMQPKPAQVIVGVVRRAGLDQVVFQRGKRGRTAHGRGDPSRRQAPRQSTATTDIMINEDFAGSVLAFDSAAAKATRLSRRELSGRRPADCQIIAIARVRGTTVATRNVRDFEGCDVEIVDPFLVS
jgi:predicted nucleic acid-binding protein